MPHKAPHRQEKDPACEGSLSDLVAKAVLLGLAPDSLLDLSLQARLLLDRAFRDRSWGRSGKSRGKLRLPEGKGSGDSRRKKNINRQIHNNNNLKQNKQLTGQKHTQSRGAGLSDLRRIFVRPCRHGGSSRTCPRMSFRRPSGPVCCSTGPFPTYPPEAA